ncbi:carotenoid 1,2-hydratase [Roseateles sp. DAIF2]|uniref:lipocalin-like domain-containing protein n=1 Tax=Roseateles sp. DAIF2 TaxID=2714952 RepID=UPI0018A29E16|nr:lipocalin-like domain-containing protein [Roseateles sp. DAIF2]QPF73919.1 carotenoid 1,2-hydratase [Roseateles sp. DAIF2]
MRRRRALMLLLPLAAGSGAARAAVQPRALQFPRDFGAHPQTGVEWWYLTGLLGPDEAPRYGYQLTFFRVRNPDPAVQAHASALAPRQLLIAHVALSDLQSSGGRLRHDQRVARLGPGGVAAAEQDCALRLRDWRLWRDEGGGYRAAFEGRAGAADAFALELRLQTTEAPLLQGEAGFSPKSPGAHHATHYYSRPQLQTRAELRLPGRAPQALTGRSWLDHEWGDELLAPEAQGWDWLGINLLDGRALTAFRLRHTGGGQDLWSGGSLRAADGTSRSFANGELRFKALRHWRSPASGASYPVAWRLSGRDFEGWTLTALLDAQEIDARASTGLLYWEGAAALRDAQGRLLGHGYLELTGYAERMRLL